MHTDLVTGLVVALDIGGTKIAGALVDGEGASAPGPGGPRPRVRTARR